MSAQLATMLLVVLGLQAVTTVQTLQDLSKVQEVAAQAAALDQQLRAATKEALQINTREKLLGHPVTDYSQTKQLADMFEPFLQFWTTAAAWQVLSIPQLTVVCAHSHQQCLV